MTEDVLTSPTIKPTSEATQPVGAPAPVRRRVAPASIAVVSGGVLLSTLGLVAYTRYHDAETRNHPERFASGVTVAGVAVGNKTPEEAETVVRDWARKQLQRPVTLIAPQSKRKWNIPLAEVGGRFDTETTLKTAFLVGKNTTVWEKIWQGGRDYKQDFPPAFLLNEVALEKQLKRVGGIMYCAPVNARARVADNGMIVLTSREKKGVSLNVAATKAALLKNGKEQLRDGATVSLVMQEEQPKVTAAALGKMGTVLASFTTDYSSSPSARAHNVELAASKLNNTLIPPGEEFSYNKVVGPREKKYGWRNALMFEDGEVVPGMGGGVCQVSSTLYNAVLRTDLKVTERQNHSIKVTYVRPGRDATVVYGVLDFRFENTTDGPLLLMSKMKNRRLTISLYGAKPKGKREVEIVSGPLRSNRYGGITVTTYRVIKNEEGKKKREYLHTDVYKAARS